MAEGFAPPKSLNRFDLLPMGKWGHRMRRDLPRITVAALLLTVPVALFLVLRASPGLDAGPPVPAQHFYAVGGVAIVSTILAVVAACASFKTASARVLLLALGFFTMAALFTLHGLATPGFLVGSEYGALVGFAGRLSVLAAASLLALSAFDLPERLSDLIARRRSVIMASWIAMLLAFDLVALSIPAAIPADFFYQPFFQRMSLILTLAFCSIAMAGYLSKYRLTRLPVYGYLVVGAAFLAEAQISMHYGTLWHYSWWLYHFQLLAGFCAILWGVASGYARGGLLSMGQLTLADPMDQIKAGYTEAIRALSTAIEVKDGYLHGLGQRVSNLALMMAGRMHLRPERQRAVAQGAFLHDLGKIAITDVILHKPGRLTPEEYEVVKGHAVHGEAILKSAGLTPLELAIIRHHHERFDGTGYPDGVGGEDLPLEVRIVTVADVYDSLRSDRSYRPAWQRERATAFMQEAAGSHFDPQCVDVFLEVIDEWETEHALLWFPPQQVALPVSAA
ncbi:MAG: HD domain-containing protein [Dehalococcoidia bacterium]|nr:HD domain-containing protein [Dehalococcoidia bacterium]